MATKAEGVCNSINNIIQSPNPFSPDVAIAVLRLSLHPRLQYNQQVHQPHLMEAANASIQQTLDKALN